MPIKASDPISDALGAAISVLRGQTSQESVADVARRHGLDWTGATVASIEHERRRLNVTEVLFLASILSEATKRKVTWRDICEAAGSQHPANPLLPLAEQDFFIDSGELANKPTTLSPLVVTPDHLGRSAAAKKLAKLAQGLSQHQREEVTRSRHQLLEAAVAKELGLDSLLVAVASQLCWGESLTSRRDRLLSIADDGRNEARTRTLRGHATRDTKDELREYLRANKIIGESK